MTRRERSFLFVPADRPERFLKAFATGADRVVIDLEDAVQPDGKTAARDTLANWLDGPDARPVMVRVNAVDTPWHADDLTALAAKPQVAGLMLPKADTAEAIAAVRAHLAADRPLVALMESIRGYLDLRRLVFTPGLSRLAFGSVDFCAETGIGGLGRELDAIRTELVVLSRAAGLPAPVEGVTLAVQDHAALEADIAHAKSFGFGGKLCIHPSQVAAVNAGFSPSQKELEWARRVMDAAAGAHGAVTVDGKLVDRPIIAQAAAILASAPPAADVLAAAS